MANRIVVATVGPMRYSGVVTGIVGDQVFFTVESAVGEATNTDYTELYPSLIGSESFAPLSDCQIYGRVVRWISDPENPGFGDVGCTTVDGQHAEPEEGNCFECGAVVAHGPSSRR